MDFSNIIFTIFLLVIAWVDLKTSLIPNLLLLIVVMIVLPMVIMEESLLSGIVGGCVGFGVVSGLFFLAPDKVGAGDVKLTGIIGLMVGYPMVFLSLLLTGIIGCLAIASLVAFKRIKVSGSIPYAPFLCSGAIIVLWAGGWIINWYWGLF